MQLFWVVNRVGFKEILDITGGVTNINIGGAQQVSFLIRAVYFVFIGWWAGLLLAWAAYALFVLVVTIPLGVMLLNLLPTVITLRNTNLRSKRYF